MISHLLFRKSSGYLPKIMVTSCSSVRCLASRILPPKSPKSPGALAHIPQPGFKIDLEKAERSQIGEDFWHKQPKAQWWQPDPVSGTWVPEKKVGTVHTAQHKEHRPQLTSPSDEKDPEELPDEVGASGEGEGEEEIKTSVTDAELQSRLTLEEASIQVALFRRTSAEVTINQTESGEGGGSATDAAPAGECVWQGCNRLEDPPHLSFTFADPASDKTRPSSDQQVAVKQLVDFQRPNNLENAREDGGSSRLPDPKWTCGRTRSPRTFGRGFKVRRVADLRSDAGRKVEPEPEPEPEPELAAAPPSVLHLLTTETHPDMLALVFKNLKGSDLCGISQVCSLWAEVAEELFQAQCQQRKWRLTRLPRGSNSHLRWPWRTLFRKRQCRSCERQGDFPIRKGIRGQLQFTLCKGCLNKPIIKSHLVRANFSVDLIGMSGKKLLPKCFDWKKHRTRNR